MLKLELCILYVPPSYLKSTANRDGEVYAQNWSEEKKVLKLAACLGCFCGFSHSLLNTVVALNLTVSQTFVG